MSSRDVHSAFVRWIAQATGLTVIKDNQDARRPQKPYIMANLIQSGALRTHFRAIAYAEADEQVTATPMLPWYWRFSVHSYSDGPEEPGDVLDLLKFEMEWGGIRLDNGMVIHEVGAVSHVPELVNEGIEDRAVVTIEVHGERSKDFAIDVAETVPVEVSRV